MRLRRAFTVTALAIAGTVTAAVPAHALPPGSLYGYYETRAQCLQAGSDPDAGWVNYWCVPDSGIWALYVDN